MAGAILILLTMFIIGPIAVFIAGAIWSAAFGWLVVEDVEATAANQPSAS
jgi:hypothetical protein